MRGCAECSAELDPRFRFCPHCGHAQRTKIVEWFRSDHRIGDGALRVSAYLTDPQHVRFSIWKDGVAEAAVSLEPAEAEKLTTFLRSIARRPAGRSVRSLVRLRR